MFKLNPHWLSIPKWWLYLNRDLLESEDSLNGWVEWWCASIFMPIGHLDMLLWLRHAQFCKSLAVWMLGKCFRCLNELRFPVMPITIESALETYQISSIQIESVIIYLSVHEFVRVSAFDLSTVCTCHYEWSECWNFERCNDLLYYQFNSTSLTIMYMIALLILRHRLLKQQREVVLAFQTLPIARRNNSERGKVSTPMVPDLRCESGSLPNLQGSGESYRLYRWRGPK